MYFFGQSRTIWGLPLIGSWRNSAVRTGWEGYTVLESMKAPEVGQWQTRIKNEIKRTKIFLKYA